MYIPTHRLLPRDQQLSTLTFNLLLVLLIFASISVIALGILFIMRRSRGNRSQRKDDLPMYADPNLHFQQGMAMSSSPRFMQSQKFLDTTTTISQDQGPLPEIHIHEAEELDEAGKQAPGKVVVVKIGEKHGDQQLHHGLPPYEELDGLHARRLREEPR